MDEGPLSEGSTGQGIRLRKWFPKGGLGSTSFVPSPHRNGHREARAFRRREERWRASMSEAPLCCGSLTGRLFSSSWVAGVSPRYEVEMMPSRRSLSGALALRLRRLRPRDPVCLQRNSPLPDRFMRPDARAHDNSLRRATRSEARARGDGESHPARRFHAARSMPPVAAAVSQPGMPLRHSGHRACRQFGRAGGLGKGCQRRRPNFFLILLLARRLWASNAPER